MESLHTQAITLSEQVTESQENTITIEYRPQYSDWIIWVGDQLEGTLLGNDIQFVDWCQVFLRSTPGVRKMILDRIYSKSMGNNGGNTFPPY